jgi:hypothetical protein
MYGIAKGGAQRRQPVLTGNVVNNFNFNFNIDNMKFGTATLWSIANALSRILRKERYTLPSMWWAQGAENCTPTPMGAHI